MRYLAQYKNRKKELKLKRLEAPNETQVRDYIRREGATEVVVLPESRGYICVSCGKLTDDPSINRVCEACRTANETT